MTRQRICVVTGSRAEYGLLYWVLHDLRADPGVELQIIATGMHLSPEYGLTVREIEADGFAVTRSVEMLLSSDTPGGLAKSIALGLIGLSDALSALTPDVVVLLGDRFEILAAAQACLIHKIPLAHIAGGDVTEGAFDESIRHSITKMAQVHFVTNEDSARRVRQMGEDPARVHVVGSPGLDHLNRRPLLARPELEAALGAPLGAKNLLVTFHPVTLDEHEGLGELDELLGALAVTPPDTRLWFTRPNADIGGRAMAARLDAFASQHSGRALIYTSLGQLRYLSLMAQVDAVVGNSSSGLYEAPSFGVATVNVGGRQRGRLAAASVLHCEADQVAISDALQLAVSMDCSGVVNPYGDGHSALRIVRILRALPPAVVLMHKPFHSIA
jgi:UDP-N-acetylglucosamine 2-epimerase (non-hydrolysing)/GDP/UDP-N,N'-diacetylbacillosamine 2-epimerase (hydrolysing)